MFLVGIYTLIYPRVKNTHHTPIIQKLKMENKESIQQQDFYGLLSWNVNFDCILISGM